MLNDQEKSFFIYTALGARELSGCPQKQGALLVQGHRILSYGFNRKIVKEESWEISAIYDALFGARQESLSGATLFCTQFPTINDLMLMVSAGINHLYFMGNIDDPETIKFVNTLNSRSIPLEIVRLQK